MDKHRPSKQLIHAMRAEVANPVMPRYYRAIKMPNTITVITISLIIRLIWINQGNL